jgi:multidrug efflux pump
MAAQGITAADVYGALSSNNYLTAVGTAKGQAVTVDLTASTDLHSLDEFKRLVIKEQNGAIVRLEDVATVVLGAENYDFSVSFDGKHSVFIGIQTAPRANVLNVVKLVKAALPGIAQQLPTGMTQDLVFDATKFINTSITEVIKTLLEALLIVTVVIFLFLGSPRAVVVPVVAMPLSLVGAFFLMLALGYSINLLTLLALVLAIGLVVDDAIIVVENVNRHLEEGMAPIAAAIQAARELGGPIIAMTVVLVAVYIPIGFQGGLTGALFTEFAFTLVGAVTVSAVIALTLSPMMCSRLLRPHVAAGGWQERLADVIDKTFAGVRGRYERWLHGSLDYLPVTGVFALIVLGSIYFLYSGAKSELAPQEDQGVVITSSTNAPNATLQQRLLYSRQVYDIFDKYPEKDHVFQIDSPAQTIGGMVLKPWDQRSRTSNQLQPIVQQDVSKIAGVRVAAFHLPPLPGSQGLPV